MREKREEEEETCKASVQKEAGREVEGTEREEVRDHKAVDA